MFSGKLDELKNVLLTYEKPSEYFESVKNNENFNEYFPELAALTGVPQNRKYHQEGDVWVHTMLVVDEAAKRKSKVSDPFAFMLSALCHDFGKAAVTETGDDGIVHAYGHEEAGIPLVSAFLSRLSAEKELTGYVLNMTRLHMEPNIMANAGSKIKSTNRLFEESVAPYDLIQLSVCDGLGKIPVSESNEEFLLKRFDAFNEIMSRPYVDADDLINAGLKDSICFDDILSHAHKLRLAGIKKDNAMIQTLAYARKLKGENRNET